MCIGYKFAHQEAMLALVRVFQKFTLRLTPGQVPLKMRTVLTCGECQKERASHTDFLAPTIHEANTPSIAQALPMASRSLYTAASAEHCGISYSDAESRIRINNTRNGWPSPHNSQPGQQLHETLSKRTKPWAAARYSAGNCTVFLQRQCGSIL